MSHTPAEIKEAVEKMNRMMRGFMVSQIMFTAMDGNVFAQLQEETTAQQTAKKNQWDPRGARILLDGLVSVGLVTKTHDKYKNTPEASLCLVPGGPAYLGHIIGHMKHLTRTWAHLTKAVRTGTGATEQYEDRSEEELRAFILGMKDISTFSARELLGVIDMTNYRHLLDLGAGPGTYAITFLQAHPQMKATLFDHPGVIEIAREEVAAAGLQDRIEYRPGDMTLTDIGNGYDLVLLSNIIHSFGDATNANLVKKIHDSMAPGGMLIIKDFFVDDDRSGPPFGLMFALNMLVNTADGDTYTFNEVAQWTRKAGFTDGHAIDMTPQTRLWLARKAASI